MNRIARPYQDECIKEIRSAFGRKLHGCVVELFTGAGKGYIIARIAELAREKGGRVLILVNRDNLCEQLFQSVAQQGLFPSMERGQDKASPMAEMVIGSIQTLQGKRLLKWAKEHFKLVICDEVHFAASKTFRATLDHFKSAWHVGLSATIGRHDGKGIWDGYEERVFAMPLTEGITEGWLVPFEFVELPVPIVIEDKLAKKKGFTEEDEAEVFRKENYLPRLFTEAAIRAQGLKSLFFWPNCDSSKEADAHFKSEGIESRHIDGYISRSQQNEILNWFAATPKGALHNADLLSYGYDNPSINCIGIMRLSKSLPMLKQRLGRGTRPNCKVDGIEAAELRRNAIAESGKPTCKVLDLMLQLGSVQHSFAVPTDLVTEDQEEREYLRKTRKGGVPVSLADLDGKLKMKRATDKDKQLARLAEDASNAARRKEYKSNGPYIDDILRMPSSGESASTKQMGFLRHLGFRDAVPLTKQMASRIIARYINAKERQSA
jgi:superfamily II DNA or RNA helicase